MATNSQNKLRFVITGWPHAKKNSKRMFKNRRTGKSFPVPSEAFERFKSDMIWQLRQLPPEIRDQFPISRPVKVITHFKTKGKIGLDADNSHTGILDILQDAEVLVNDKQAIKGSYSKVGGYPDWSTVIIIKIY